MTKAQANEILACFYIGKRRMPSLSEYKQLGLSDFIWHWDVMLAGGIDPRTIAGIPLVKVVNLIRFERALSDR